MRLRPIIGWAVFCFLFAIIARAVPSPTAAFHFFNGKRLIYSRNYEAAISSYQQAVDANPKFARAHVEIGSINVALKNYDAAEVAFKNAMSAEEDSCAACGLGMVYRLQGKQAEAEAILRRSIELNRHDTCPYNQLGRLYYGREEYFKAAKEFDEEIKLQPSAVSLHFLANCIYFSGGATESLQYYKRAIRINRDYEPIYIDLARAYNVSGRHNDAIKTYYTALRFDPNNTIAHDGLGFTYMIMGNTEAAYEQYEALLPLDGKMAGRLLREIKRRMPPENVSTSSR